jgi:hypothetical protein
MALLAVAAVSLGSVASARTLQPSARVAIQGGSAVHAIQLGHKKKKEHKKHKAGLGLSSAYGSVPAGTYQASYRLSYPSSGDSTAWENGGAPMTLSVAAKNAFNDGLTQFNKQYSTECASEGAALHLTLSCRVSYQAWNGTYFGITFTGATSGGVYDTMALRYTKVG